MKNSAQNFFAPFVENFSAVFEKGGRKGERGRYKREIEK
jgi:hypothetical protein